MPDFLDHDYWSDPNRTKVILEVLRQSQVRKSKRDIPDLTRQILEKLPALEGVCLMDEGRIRQVQGTCAIEANPLSIEEVEKVFHGESVEASKRHLAEIENSIAVYKRLESGDFDPWEMESLLSAHETLMGDLMDGRLGGGGKLRTYDVRVGNYFPPPHQEVEKRINALFDETDKWFSKTWYSDDPGNWDGILEFAASWHYKFESIHPFGDGNGRMGRLWQTLILSRFDSNFEWLPVEQAIWEHRMAYYEALSDSRLEDHSIFVAFMLERILAAMQWTQEQD